MIAVHKYPITTDIPLLIAMQKDAQLLTVQVQRGEPQLWALVEQGQANEIREFVVVGTGHSIPVPKHQLEYVTTFQLQEGSLVFHVFEVKR